MTQPSVFFVRDLVPLYLLDIDIYRMATHRLPFRLRYRARKLMNIGLGMLVPRGTILHCVRCTLAPTALDALAQGTVTLQEMTRELRRPTCELHRARPMTKLLCDSALAGVLDYLVGSDNAYYQKTACVKKEAYGIAHHPAFWLPLQTMEE